MIRLYECSFCDDIFDKKNKCIEHENICVGNPKQRSCYTCGLIWSHQEPDETWRSCDKKLMEYKNSSRGDYMSNCEGWEPESNRRKQ